MALKSKRFIYQMPVEYGLTFKEMREAFAKTKGVQFSGVDVGGKYELMDVLPAGRQVFFRGNYF